MISKKTIIYLFIIIFLLSSLSVTGNNKFVNIVKIDEAITGATTELIKEAIDLSEKDNCVATLILLNTQGGSLDETFKIADLIENSKKPVIGFVYPSGAKAWSAGVFILESTHIAVMAPHTIVGSCQPIELTPTGTKYINDSKIINALVEWLEERANSHGRNSSIMSKFVVENLNLNASEALKSGAIDYVEKNVDSLLETLDGKTIETIYGNTTLYTQNIDKILFKPSIKIYILRIISNPIVASLLLITGLFSLLIGLSTPGYGAEVFGVIAIIVSLLAMGLSISYIAILLLIIGFILLSIELFVTPGFGIIGIGGIISIIFGALFLIPNYQNMKWLISQEYQQMLVIFVLAPVLVIAAFFIFILIKFLKIRRKKPAIDVIGKEAVVVDKLSSDKEGYVKLEGEYWRARAYKGKIQPGTEVVVVGREDLTLIVKPKTR